MHILNVELKDCAFSPETGQFHATLLMDTGTQRLSLRAAAEHHDGMRRGDMAKGLLGDALRQLNRMPEYRNTERQITVAQDALCAASPLMMAA